MKRIPFTVVLILMFFAAYSSAITLKELKKYQAAIKNACPPEAGCEDETQMQQPSESEVEENLGVKGLCRYGGPGVCSTKKDKHCKKAEEGEYCENPPECIVITGGIGKDTCGVHSKKRRCYDGEKYLWENRGEAQPENGHLTMLGESECIYVVPLNKSGSEHFVCSGGPCKTKGNAIVLMHFGCFEASCTADAMEIYLKSK